jgi:hypothetical protein
MVGPDTWVIPWNPCWLLFFFLIFSRPLVELLGKNIVLGCRNPVNNLPQKVVDPLLPVGQPDTLPDLGLGWNSSHLLSPFTDPYMIR